ncbi:hypothetical protein [Hathewaya limosa]|uniref:Uncharacterized protein n=1 Tax=Hathewaya limosa TaxID=1536 RepID=A0ABU0JTR4_HATLI|nr:hypothetical protein [Hathewaya limosa]MDQ0480480.1 hypothetical protein [Hathewaya limosa]
MKILESLKGTTDKEMNLSELVNAFKEMCKITIDGVNEEDDMLLFEVETFSGQSMTHFSLVRQFPNEEEEYTQLHLDIQYKTNAQNKLFSQTIWSEDVEDDFLKFIKNSHAYLFLKDKQIYKVNVFMDET